MKHASDSAYRKTVDILFQYYHATDGYYDQLGAMLSDMEYESWVPLENEPLVSGDPSIFSDWTETWDRLVGTGKEGTPKQVFKVAKTILDYYSAEVEYEIGDAESYLREQLGA